MQLATVECSGFRQFCEHDYAREVVNVMIAMHVDKTLRESL